MLTFEAKFCRMEEVVIKGWRGLLHTGEKDIKTQKIKKNAYFNGAVQNGFRFSG